jgi:hypothetical protein
MAPFAIEPKAQYQVNLFAAPMYVLLYTYDTNDGCGTVPFCMAQSIPVLKEKMKQHIGNNGFFKRDGTHSLDGFTVYEHDYQINDHNNRAFLWVAEGKSDEYIEYTIMLTPFVISETEGVPS